MSKHFYLLQSFLFILLTIFFLLIVEIQIFDLVYLLKFNKQMVILLVVTFLVLIFWLLSLTSFYKFSYLINSEKMARQADQLQIEESHKLIQTLQSQRHDFRNQLQVIRVLAQLGKEEEMIKYIDEYVSISDISLSVPERIDNAAISAMLLVYAMEAKEKGILFSIDSDIDFSHFVLSPAKMTRILGNIIRNAIEIFEKNAQADRSIQLTMWENEDHYTFLIWNNGPLIPENLISKLFVPGFSTKNSSGLGLAIVKELVNDLNGKITVKSLPDYGTEFKITIPRRNYKMIL